MAAPPPATIDTVVVTLRDDAHVLLPTQPPSCPAGYDRLTPDGPTVNPVMSRQPGPRPADPFRLRDGAVRNGPQSVRPIPTGMSDEGTHLLGKLLAQLTVEPAALPTVRLHNGRTDRAILRSRPV